MVEPEKPFACTIPECGMTFTNEDHLHVHTRKHDMMLQLGEQKGAVFVADQTPTPTRFIRNCEEVGLFQDLQNVNPFDEGFKRAMETKQGILSLESLPSSQDDLHTPQMFPLIDPTNITISRSSSDESGAIKEFETTTISKCTNEVTTISRVVKHDEQKHDEKNTKNNSVFTNNVIKIQSNVEIRKSDIDKASDGKQEEIPPIMSQKSIDYVVDSLTSDLEKKNNDYEVLIKLPTGQQIKLTSAEEKKTPKEILKKVLTNKVEPQPVIVPTILNVAAGTLIPVSIVTPKVNKLPIVYDKKPVKRKNVDKCPNTSKKDSEGNSQKNNLDSRCAASRRYRARIKEEMSRKSVENKHLKELNEQLASENAVLKTIIVEHMKRCPNAEDLRDLKAKSRPT